MSRITTHILDVSKGCPASAVPVTLERQTPVGWELVGEGATDDDGRIGNLSESAAAGVYRLTFNTADYFTKQKIEGFYPQVTIEFAVRDAAQHYHVPLLLSSFGYSTYRGS